MANHYIAARLRNGDGVYRFDHEARTMEFCWSRDVARGASRNQIDDNQLMALNVRAKAGNPTAKRAMEFLEHGETLTNVWRDQVARLIN